MKIQINNLKGLPKAASQFLEYIGNQKKFAVYGEMGLGKTTFITELCRQMKTNDNIASPTYSIVNQYITNKGKVVHIDLYRLNAIEEALDIGIEDFLYDNNYCFIEWPNLIEPILPNTFKKIEFELGESNSRILYLS